MEAMGLYVDAEQMVKNDLLKVDTINVELAKGSGGASKRKEK